MSLIWIFITQNEQSNSAKICFLKMDSFKAIEILHFTYGHFAKLGNIIESILFLSCIYEYLNLNLFVPLLKVVWKSKSTYLTSGNDNIFQPFLIVPSWKGSLTIFFIVIYSFHTSPLGDISTPFVRGGNHFNDCLAQRFLTVLFKDFSFSISARGSWDTHHLWERLRKINGEFQSQSGRCQRINENFRLQERIKFLRSATLVGKRRWECLGTISIKLKTKTMTGKKRQK